ncbi:MAG TPA: hypothetical protein VJT84_06945, partial [Gaiellaceae bacterium]|nr:hypothetical protein [Gaiellaceae bacterium]
AERMLPAVAAALLAGWTASALPFFPAYWPGGLAAVAAGVTLASPRLGLAFALAVPILPLGNIALGLGVLYLLVACGWLLLHWRTSRLGLLFVAGPLLATIGALGLLPLALLPVAGWPRRTAQAAAAVLAAALVASLGGHGLPIVGDHAPDLAIAETNGPLSAASSLWDGLRSTQPLLLETGALAVCAAAIGSCRRRGNWAAAGYGSLLTSLTLIAEPSASAAPLVAAAWLSALLLALEPASAPRGAAISRLMRRISPVRARLRLVGWS